MKVIGVLFAVVVGVLFGFVALRVQQAGGPDQAFYELLQKVAGGIEVGGRGRVRGLLKATWQPF
jgi:hypothetical protein